MLIYCCGRLYYSDVLVCLTAAAMLAFPPILWFVCLHEPLSVPLGSPIDWLLASTLLTGVYVPWLRWNLLPGGSAGHNSLYLLRCSSALVAALMLTALLVHLVPRPVLLLMTTLSVALSLNAFTWITSLWLHLQREGAVLMMPTSLRELLTRTPPIDLLGRDAPLVLFLTRWWQLCGILLLREEEREEALKLIPEALRRRLVRPGLQGELPATVRQLLQPWRSGPPHLRVLQLASQTALDDDSSRDSSDSNLPPPAAAVAPPAHVPAPPEDCQRSATGRAAHAPPSSSARSRLQAPPEWLLLFVLKRLVVRAFRGRVSRPSAAQAAAATALLVALLLRVGRGQPLRRWRRIAGRRPTLVLLLLAAVVLLRFWRVPHSARRVSKGRALLLTLPRMLLAFVPVRLRERLDVDAVLAKCVNFIFDRLMMYE